MGQTTIEWTASPRPDGTWASGYTKRIENLRRFSPWPDRLLPRNVWLGAACEDQERFDQRYPILSAAQARVHFVSYEPAIGPLSIRNTYPAPDWIICGGESGACARYMEPN
jgi:protein gp37